MGGDKGSYGLNALGRWSKGGREWRGEEKGERMGVTIDDIHSLLKLSPIPKFHSQAEEWSLGMRLKSVYQPLETV